MLNINSMNTVPPQVPTPIESKKETAIVQNPVQNPPKKSGLLDKFETSIRNAADVRDTVKVPRTIFKGYLSIMTGSTLISLAMLTKIKNPKLSNFFNVVSAGLMIFGTYSFTRPYLFKNQKENKP